MVNTLAKAMSDKYLIGKQLLLKIRVIIMPRNERKKSSTGVYHVMMRGINKQRIFEDDEDCLKLLNTLAKFQKVSDYTIYAYCLMGNHIHLLIKEGNEELGNTFKRIGTSYVQWYNGKYSRTGHLFQDRYKSEVVEDERYFLTVLRYIHQNPLKAGIVIDLESYQWSSYNEYVTTEKSLCDTEFPLSLYSKNLTEALTSFKNFHQQDNEDECLEYQEQNRLSDVEAQEAIKSIAKLRYPQELQTIEPSERNLAIMKLRRNGLSIRQIQRLTGISVGIIRKVTN